EEGDGRHTLGEQGKVEKRAEVREGGMEREEGVRAEVVELGIGTDGGDHHPVERKQRHADHEHQRDLERHRPFEWASVPDRHPQSLRRMYQSWNTMTTRRNGKRKSEIEAPCPSLAARMASS